MDEKELIKERFKSAVTSAVKAISENYDLEIKFGHSISNKKNSLNLPDLLNLKNLQDFTNLRAFADSEALKIKYKSDKIFKKNEPKGSMAKALYAIAEKIRYEKIGSNKLKGVKNNITQCYENKFKNKKIDEIKTEADVPVTEAFELYLRSHFFNIKQNNTTKEVLSYWKDLFDKNLKNKLIKLEDCLENQSEFSSIMAELIDNLDFEDSDTKEKEEKTETPQDNASSDNDEDNNDSSENNNEKNEDTESNLMENTLEAFDENENSEEKEVKEINADLNSTRKSQQNLNKHKYKIFTSEYDEIKNAEDLEKEDEILRLRKNLDQQLTSLQSLVAKLANKLQRQLLAKQNRSWEFDLEEGMLDSSKLSRIIIDPFHSLSYKME